MKQDHPRGNVGSKKGLLPTRFGLATIGDAAAGHFMAVWGLSLATAAAGRFIPCRRYLLAIASDT